MWPSPLMGKMVVALGKGKEGSKVTGVSTSAIFHTCAKICKDKIKFICLNFIFCKALEQKNRFFLRSEIEFSFHHEALCWSVRYVLGKRSQSPESNCAFS